MADGRLGWVAAVADYDDDRGQALAEQGAEFGRGLLHGGVAGDQHDAPVRGGQRGAEGGRQAPACRNPERLPGQLGPVGQVSPAAPSKAAPWSAISRSPGAQEFLDARPQAGLGERAAAGVRRGPACHLDGVGHRLQGPERGE